MITELKLYLRKLISSDTFRNISFLSIGQMVAQIFSLVVIFYVPKKLGTSVYGDYQIVVNYVMMFKLLTFTGLNKVNIRNIARHNTDSSANEIMSEALGLRLSFGLMSVIFALLISFNMPYEEGVVYGICVFAFYLILFAVENHIFSFFYGIQKMKYLAIINVVKSFLLSSAIIVIVYFTSSIILMVTSYLIIELIVVVMTVIIAHYKCNFRIRISRPSENVDLRSSLRFSIIDIFNLLSSRVDIFMLSILTTPANVGIYAISSSLVRKGLIVRRSVAQAIFPKYAREIKEISMKDLFRHMIWIALVGLFLVCVLNIAVPLLVKYVLGQDYASTTVITQILSIYILFHYAVIPFSTFLEAADKEVNVIWVGLCRSIINILLNYLFFIKYGLIGIAYSTMIIWMLNLIMNIYFAHSVYKINTKGEV